MTPPAGAAPRRPTVAFFTPGWPAGSQPNGIVTYVANLRPALAELGVGAQVVGFAIPTTGPDPGAVDFETFPHSFARRLALSALSRLPGVPVAAMSWGWRIADGLGAAVARGELDLLEMEESFGAAYYAQQGLDVPVVVRLHGPRFLNGAALGLPEDSDFHRIERAERRCITAAVGLTAPSRDVLQRVRRRYGAALPHAAVIPNPVPIVPPQRRWRLGACDGKTMLFVGRFDRHKGGDLVVDAFRAVAAARPDAELAFVGPDRGLRDPAGGTQSLPQYLDQHLPPSIRARVRVHGTLRGDAIAELRRRSFVTVVASRYEIFGLALAEALAAGCPAVAADAGGIPEVMLSDRTGLLFRAGDAGDLAAKVLALFANPARAAALGAAAAEDVALRLASGPVARATLDYYQALLADPARRPRRRFDLGGALQALGGASRGRSRS